jgi:membrane protease YdiL (CAAX protease family)
MVSLSGNGRKMNSEFGQSGSAPETPGYSVPWRFMDNWIGVALLALIDTVVFIIMSWGPRTDVFQSAAVIMLESAYLLPVVLILAWRGIHWKHLGFGRFEWKTLGLGCGLLIAGYSLIMLYGLLLLAFGIETQGEQIVRVLAELDTPFWFFLVAVVFAPIVEEIFFRGFLFQGFRERYGWIKAMLLSSTIFAIAHLDPVSLIPTFILGNVLAYVYHRSNSVWPGVILHFLVNAFSSSLAYFLLQNPNLIPV